MSLMIVPSWVVVTALVSVTDMRDDNFISHLGGVHKTALQYIITTCGSFGTIGERLRHFKWRKSFHVRPFNL